MSETWAHRLDDKRAKTVPKKMTGRVLTPARGVRAARSDVREASRIGSGLAPPPKTTWRWIKVKDRAHPAYTRVKDSLQGLKCPVLFVLGC